MANTPTSSENNAHMDATIPDSTPTTTLGPDPAVAPRSSPQPTRGRWVLSSIAAAGLLVIGLLGGMLIGQQMVHPGMHNEGSPARVSIQKDHQGQNREAPLRLKERLKERHDRQATRGNPREVAPSPSQTAPDGDTSKESSPPQNNG